MTDTLLNIWAGLDLIALALLIAIFACLGIALVLSAIQLHKEGRL